MCGTSAVPLIKLKLTSYLSAGRYIRCYEETYTYGGSKLAVQYSSQVNLSWDVGSWQVSGVEGRRAAPAHIRPSCPASCSAPWRVSQRRHTPRRVDGLVHKVPPRRLGERRVRYVMLRVAASGRHNAGAALEGRNIIALCEDAGTAVVAAGCIWAAQKLPGGVQRRQEWLHVLMADKAWLSVVLTDMPLMRRKPAGATV